MERKIEELEREESTTTFDMDKRAELEMKLDKLSRKLQYTIESYHTLVKIRNKEINEIK